MATVRIVLTGFGSFPGVPQNPTEQLLAEFAARPPLPLAECCVLPVAAQDVDEWHVTKLQPLLRSLPADEALLICHLGVDGQGHHVKLEQCSYNDASFRMADVRGFQPAEGSPIDCCAAPGLCLRSGLDLEAVSAELRAQGLAVAVSEDAGRYLCNVRGAHTRGQQGRAGYVFYRSCSLLLATQHQEVRAPMPATAATPLDVNKMPPPVQPATAGDATWATASAPATRAAQSPQPAQPAQPQLAPASPIATGAARLDSLGTTAHHHAAGQQGSRPGPGEQQALPGSRRCCPAPRHAVFVHVPPVGRLALIDSQKVVEAALQAMVRQMVQAVAA
ncbi:hypothetical protein QJQ45_019607 [Haematococcus lacustris]|nr:hypothetical protein QJQ45_019607 [Haematococcus lacustris]